MFNVTVEEAAARLGVGRQRVYQLIRQGALAAEKVGGIWLVDDFSVAQRSKAAPRPGRPSKASRLTSDVGEYMLMNRTHPVLAFRYDAARAKFVDVGAVEDAARAPLGLVSPRGKTVSADALAYWWRHRSIPATREGLDAKLADLGVAHADQIPFKSLGFSLSDQYWIRPAESPNITWAALNYFDNEFEELSNTGSDWLADVGLDSPDNTSEGELPKRWVCRGGKRLLVKGGTALGQEPFNEVAATALHARLLKAGEFVPYELVESGAETACASACFVSSEEEYIPAYYVRAVLRKPNHRNDFQQYLECCAELGVSDVEQALSQMLVCDDILANEDRHWRNFGIIRNVETLECRVAPLFDSGSCLWHRATMGQVAAGDHAFASKPFYEDPNRQLRLVNDYSWFDPAALDGFAQQVADILRGNPALANRVDFICEGVQARIDRIVRML